MVKLCHKNPRSYRLATMEMQKIDDLGSHLEGARIVQKSNSNDVENKVSENIVFLNYGAKNTAPNWP